MSAMKPQDLEHLQGLLASRAGFRLTRDRLSLVEHRLAPLARREGFASVEQLIQALRDRPVGELAWAAIEAMLTPETWFHRDRAPFATFRQEVLPAIAKVRPGGRVRVLSAGCSTGQEAYSLAMAALETGMAAEIVAIDLSSRALEKAQAGLYTQFEIQRGLPARQLLKWFDKSEDMWRARPELRAAVRFARANLLDDPVEAEPFDVIFCRNVLGDFDPAKRARLFDVLARALADDGCLFLGVNDGAGEPPEAFRPVSGRRGLYVKSPGAIRRAA